MATMSAIVKWASNTDQLIQQLKGGEDAVFALEKAAQKTARALGGEGLIRAANNTAAALVELGNSSKLTVTEQERVVRQLDKAIEKYTALGQVAPSGIRQMAEALRTTVAESKRLAEEAAAVQKHVSAFSGTKIIQEAGQIARAVEQIGGASKLTAGEQTRVNAVVTEALAKYSALGREAPQQLRALATATNPVQREMSDLTAHIAKVNELARKFGGSDTIQQARQYAQAVAQVGGASKLTQAEQKAVNAVVTEAIAKYQALGQSAPKALLDLADATRQVEPPTKNAAFSIGQLFTAITGGVTIGNLAADAIKGVLRQIVEIPRQIAAAVVSLGTHGSEVAQVSTSFQALSAAVKQSGDEILQSTRQASKGLVADMDIMAAANKGLLLGLPITADEMGTLAKTAIVLGGAMRVGPTQALNDLITGLGRGSAAILDNLGITVKAEESQQKYAASIGKAAKDLTDAEKKIAIYTSALESARAKVDEIGDIQIRFAQRLQQVSVWWTNLQDGFSKTLAESPALERALGRVIVLLHGNGLAGAAEGAAAILAGVLATGIDLAVDGAEGLVAILRDLIPALREAYAEVIKPAWTNLRDAFDQTNRAWTNLKPDLLELISVLATGQRAWGAMANEMSLWSLAAQGIKTTVDLFILRPLNAAAAVLNLFSLKLKQFADEVRLLQTLKDFVTGATPNNRPATPAAPAAFTPAPIPTGLGADAALKLSRSLEQAAQGTRQLTDAQKAYNEQVQAMVRAFTGADVIKKAEQTIAAINVATRQGIPLQKMTRDQQDAINKAMVDALAVYTALGRVAPKAIRDTYLATLDWKAAMEGSERAADALFRKDFDARFARNVAGLKREQEAWFGLQQALQDADEVAGKVFKADAAARFARNAAAISDGTDEIVADLEDANDRLSEWINGLFDAADALRALASVSDGVFGRILNDIALAVEGAADLAAGFARISSGDIIGGTAQMISGAVKVFKALKNIFTDSQAEKVMRDIGRDWGVAISDGLAEAIAEDADRIGRMDAPLLHLAEIFEEAGGVLEFGLDRAIERTRQLFSAIERGTITAGQAVEQLERVFPDLAAAMVDTGEIASREFLELIELANRFGLQVEAITNHLKQQGERFANGLAAMMRPFQTRFNTTISELKKLADEMDVEFSIAPGTNVADLSREQRIFLDQQRGTLAQLVPEYERFGRLAVAAFNGAIASGLTLPQAIDALGPALDALIPIQQQLNDLGIEAGSAALNELLAKRELVNANRDLLEAAGALNEVTLALSHLNGLNADTLADLGAQGAQTYDRLIAAGFSEKDALMEIQGWLITVKKAYTELGIPIDENTQRLLDLADANGVATDEALSMQDILMLGFSAIIEALGGDIPDAFKTFRDAGVDAANDVRGAIDQIPKHVRVNVDMDTPDLPEAPPEHAATGGVVGMGKILPFTAGGLVPKYFDIGGEVGRLIRFIPKGTDTVPAMLTPGEVVLNAAQQRNVAEAIINRQSPDLRSDRAASATGGTTTIIIERDGRKEAEFIAPHLPGAVKRLRLA